MDRITLERKYLNMVDGQKSTREIREGLQKEAILNGWFAETLPGEIKSTLIRLWDKGIISIDSNHIVHKVQKK